MSRLRITLASSIACLFVAGAAGLMPTAARGRPAAADDEAAIKEVVRRYVDAREAEDPKAIEALFTADADQLVSDGTWRKGRDELVRGMLESSRKAGGKRTIAVESVRLLGPDVAMADGRYTQTGLAGGTNRAMWTTIVLKRTPDGWRIAAIRNMLPATPAPPTRSTSSGEKKVQPTVKYQAEEGLPQDEAAEKRRDYAVLEAALDDLASLKNPEYKFRIESFRRGREIVIDDNTCEDGPRDPGDESLDSDNKDPRPIPDDIREDLGRRNHGPVRSLADFKPANPNIILRDMDELFEQATGPFSANVEFIKRYPYAWGYVLAHVPGYSRDGNSAIVLFEGGRNGEHGLDWVYMLTRKGKRWEVLWRHLHVHE